MDDATNLFPQLRKENPTISPPAIVISGRRGDGGKEKSNGAALPAIQFTELSLRLTLRANIHRDVKKVEG